MGNEIDLLVNYPRTKRDVNQRAKEKTEEDRIIARQFGKEFFDGDRKHGYGGFSYHPRFWQPVMPTLTEHFELTSTDKLLDIGCAKGFMLYDLVQSIPGMQCFGIDISEYAIKQSLFHVKPNLMVATAEALPFPDKSFDVIISVTTLHNLEKPRLIQALKEIERVKIRGSFITVDAYHNDQEKARMEDWNLTARTVLHVNEWLELFDKAGYTGDFYWFTP